MNHQKGGLFMLRVSDKGFRKLISENMPESDVVELPRIVIIGGGFAGLQVARNLKSLPAHITVIDRTNHHLFQPLLYQVATATLSPGEISAPIRYVLRDQRNTQVLMAEVTGIDTQARHVLMHNQILPYDYLVIATGSHEHYFAHPEWQALAPGLKSLEDARTIRQKILLAFEMAELESDPLRRQELLTFVIIGAGPTGVELAGDLADVAHKALKKEYHQADLSQTHIVLIERGSRILTNYPEHLAHHAHNKLQGLGVDIRTGVSVTSIDEQGVTVADQYIRTHNVFWTAGIKASPAASWLGVASDRIGRVLVEPDFSVPGYPDIFVIGDTAHYEQNGKPLPGIAPVAMQEGRYMAYLLKKRLVPAKKSQAINAFHYHDKGNIATIGRAYTVVQIGRLEMAGWLAWLFGLMVHLFYLIGFGNRILVMLQWASAYLTFHRRVRIVSSDSRLTTVGKSNGQADHKAQAEDYVLINK